MSPSRSAATSSPATSPTWTPTARWSTSRSTRAAAWTSPSSTRAWRPAAASARTSTSRSTAAPSGANLDGVVFGTHAVLPALRARGGGAIVATASLAGLTGVPIDPLYAANKHAVVGLARSLGDVLAADGITYNAICPGFAESRIVDPIRDLLAESGRDAHPGRGRRRRRCCASSPAARPARRGSSSPAASRGRSASATFPARAGPRRPSRPGAGYAITRKLAVTGPTRLPCASTADSASR